MAVPLESTFVESVHTLGQLVMTACDDMRRGNVTAKVFLVCYSCFCTQSYNAGTKLCRRNMLQGILLKRKQIKFSMRHHVDCSCRLSRPLPYLSNMEINQYPLRASMHRIAFCPYNVLCARTKGLFPSLHSRGMSPGVYGLL